MCCSMLTNSSKQFPLIHLTQALRKHVLVLQLIIVGNRIEEEGLDIIVIYLIAQSAGCL